MNVSGFTPLLATVKSKLREEFSKAGRLEVFDALQVYLSGGEAPYQAVAQQLEMSVDSVKKNVERMRRQFGQILRDEIGETVLHPSEIEDELRFLRESLKN
ncbi:hypothetical protein N8766_03270 [bacterium]|jgi:hypothetical protein|nr:hypothetical protein [bacterium]